MSGSTLPAVAPPADRLAGMRLCVLVDGGENAGRFGHVVAALFEAGLRCLQVRDKALSTAVLVERVQAALAAAGRHPGADGAPLVIVNDRADVARACQAAGVHVGADDLPVPMARDVVGLGSLVGRTTHDMAAVRRAVADGADYIGVGPCFPSATKTFAALAPRDFLAAAVRESGLPAFAIGGVTLERLDELAALGVTRVAVASAVTAATDPAAATAAFISRLARLVPRPGPRP
ncbi:MAG: thiamine phosphate synthase [Planctomycetia bacterium]|nr:thiamine phosphate synthase [Planctomycetia bacterium]